MRKHSVRPGQYAIPYASDPKELIFQLVISTTVAYLASRTLSVSTDYLQVFRVTGTVAFLAYGAASVPETVWFPHSKTQLVKNLVDALVYGVLTAGFFGRSRPS